MTHIYLTLAFTLKITKENYFHNILIMINFYFLTTLSTLKNYNESL